MRFNTLKYFVSDSIRSLNRNKTVTIASIATVTATFFIFGIFLLTMITGKLLINEVGSKLEVKIYLNDNITTSQQSDISNKVKDISGVTDVKYVSKSQAFNDFKQQIGNENEDLLDGLDKNNFMPASFVVNVEKPEIISKVTKDIKSMPGIEQVKDARDYVNQVIAVSHTIQGIGLVLLVILLGVSLFLIGNTIKLTVYSRRREINIMKYIGATDWFIRWPFVLEGVFIGVIGSIISDLVLYYGYKYVYLKVTTQFLTASLVSPSYVLTTILFEFIVSGIIIGSIGSIFSIRKFLQV